jgi:hypothetical protein
LRPIRDHETTKVAAAMRQSMENPKMMSRLLERIKVGYSRTTFANLQMTEDPVIQRQMMRMHGFSLMAMILTDMQSDRDIVVLCLQSLLNWKLQIRNKIEDSNIEEIVKAMRDGPDEELAGLAKHLLEYWSTLELSYKIPRMSKIQSVRATGLTWRLRHSLTTTMSRTLQLSRRPTPCLGDTFRWTIWSTRLASSSILLLFVMFPSLYHSSAPVLCLHPRRRQSHILMLSRVTA